MPCNGRPSSGSAESDYLVRAAPTSGTILPWPSHQINRLVTSERALTLELGAELFASADNSCPAKWPNSKAGGTRRGKQGRKPGNITLNACTECKKKRAKSAMADALALHALLATGELAFTPSHWNCNETRSFWHFRDVFCSF